MTIAVLSDIHGVLPALDAILAEPDLRAADHIVVTGDVAAGPQPNRVLDRLAELGDRVTHVSGNADRELLTWQPGAPVPDPIVPWAAHELTEHHRTRMAAWPATHTIDIPGLGPTLFCHATPRNDTEVVLVDSRPARWTETLADVPDHITTIVCGHTHMPYARLAAGRMIVNPGSVGMPYGPPGAYWALLGPGVQLRRTPLNADTACAQVIADSTYPDATAFTDDYMRGRYSDLDALAVFAPRDGRDSTPTA